jgi:hypothetical protein
MSKPIYVYVLASVGVYALAAFLLWPTLDFGTVGLDDASLLQVFSNAPFASVWGRDHFGHFRPLKNLLFWCLSRDMEQLPLVRGGLAAIVLVSAALLQRLATTLFGGRWWGLMAATFWLLNPTTAGTVAWIAAANYPLALFFVLIYLALSTRAPLNGAWASKLVVAGAFLALVAAALCHELALTAPILVLATPPKRIGLPALGRRPFVLALAAFMSAGFVVVARFFAAGVDVAYRSATYPTGQLAFSSNADRLGRLGLLIEAA